MCSIDDGFRFDCSLPRDIDELATTYNLTSGDHNISVMTLDVFGQSDITVVTFTVRKLMISLAFICSASVYIPPIEVTFTVFCTLSLETNVTPQWISLTLSHV